MRLNKREKSLIYMLLLVVLVAIVYYAYTYITLDSVFKLSALREEYSQIKPEYDAMSQNIIEKNRYEKYLQELSNEINNVNVISDLQQEQLIIFMNNYLEKNKISTNNLSFTDITAIPVETNLPQAQMRENSMFENILQNVILTTTEGLNKSLGAIENIEQQTTRDELMTVKSISVNFSYESTYEDMLKFIDSIQFNKVDIAITNISTASQTGETIQGAMTLKFFTIPKLEDYVEENKDWIWEDVALSGKYNMFTMGSRSDFSNTVVSDFDFYMSLKPENSHLPTVTIGRTDDKIMSTYLYEDSNEIEDVELQFKIENAKYYYKYFTKNSKYPQDGTWVEFVPKAKSINIKIYSTRRNSKEDLAGVNINIVNTSKLKVRFEIENDDKTNPRVYFKDPKSVVVTRNEIY